VAVFLIYKEKLMATPTKTSTEEKVKKPVLQSFYVGKFDRTVKAATPAEAIKLASKQENNKEEK
jgi:hypothetical protein